MGVWDSKMIAQGLGSVSTSCFVEYSALAGQKSRKLFFIALTAKDVFILWFFALLKYTPCHVIDYFIYSVNLLESLVVKSNVTIDHHNLFIPIHWSYFLHIHHTNLTEVNSTRRNIPLKIQSFRVVGSKMMRYPFALPTVSSISGIIF